MFKNNKYLNLYSITGILLIILALLFIYINNMELKTEAVVPDLNKKIVSLERSAEKSEEVDVETLLELGKLYEMKSRYQDANEVYLRASKDFPEEYLVWHRLANVSTVLKDEKKAIEYRREALKVNSSSEMQYYLSQNLLTVNLEEALVAAKRAVKLEIKKENEFLSNYVEVLEKVKNTQSFESYKELLKSENGFIAFKEISVSLLDKLILNASDDEKEKYEELKKDL